MPWLGLLRATRMGDGALEDQITKRQSAKAAAV